MISTTITSVSNITCEVIDIFNDNGTLNEKAELYIGEDRFDVRKKITRRAYSDKGHMVKDEDICEQGRIFRAYRCGH